MAAFARERRESYGGYPEVFHFMARGAWTALVGHPRVFVDDEEQPIEVARGTVQVVARSKGDAFVVALEPADVSDEITIRRDGIRIVVFDPTEAVRGLAQIIGTGLTLPESGRARALEALGGIAHLVPVQSSEQSKARRGSSDSTPWARLVPRGSAISITVTVRPLGGGGSHVVPGLGATTLLGRVNGEPVQPERDLKEERRLVRSVMEAVGLAEGEALGNPVTLEDPEACLEAISALRALGPSVHVEWPQGMPLRIRGRIGRKALRGRLTQGVDFFLATATFAVDDDLSADLEALLALVAERPGKFVRLETGGYVELEHELRELLESLSAVRAEGRAQTRGAVIPKSAIGLLDRLTEADSGLALDAGTARFRERLLQVTEKRFRVPRGLSAELRPYQREGFEWLCRLAELELGACLADDMGLGKTVQLIALLLHRAKSGPALVVAPTSVCDNWHCELERFAPALRVRPYAAGARQGVLVGLTGAQIVITSYALLQQDAEALQAVEWSTVILDEAQLVKNAESQRAKAAFGLRASFRVVATGTPVENHLGDLFSLFKFAMPGLLGGWTSFNQRFGGAGAEEAGKIARRSLRRLIKPFILRRTKAQVLDDLPPLTEIQHTVTLSAEEARLYEAVRRTALAKLASTSDEPRARVQILAEITRLRRLCCHPRLAAADAELGSSKVAAFLDLVAELTEGRHRALAFSQFVDMLTLVRASLDERGISYQYLDGSSTVKQRAAAVDAFQAGEGDVIHLDPWWNPAVESQASDRAHRIGQTRPVTVYRLVTAGTVEERIVELHRKKRDLADALLDDTARSATLSVEELRTLFDGGVFEPDVSPRSVGRAR